ncbi:hypothetical protein NEF87_000083 [Candidatus Lokiarchaeum ossiferum]|uniref:Uncharacterized protein n=1 Tax=Candidatus Lokiarchaeum ossiferum TaxID=2951803 RepID=A0ABY6HJW5_9ARCH|nr:hypothetical protein NEF87_000083 [Candidatus Lokiarchaeum sp. B-35]
MVSDKEYERGPESNGDSVDESLTEGPVEELSATAEELPPEPIKLGFKEIVEKELGLIKVCDYIASNPFDLIFQTKLIEKYSKEIIHPLIGGEEAPEECDGGRLFLREEYEQLNIAEKMQSIITTGESVARQNGIKAHVQKTMSRWSLVIYALAMVSYFGLMTLFPEANSTFILIPVFLIMCMGPQFLRSFFTKRWEKFKLAHTKTVLEQERTNIQDLKTFIQDLINDTRERLLDNKVTLDKIQFVLVSNDYENVQFIRSQGGTRGQPLSSVYQFSYPEGMGPSNVQSNYGKSGIPEDDNDSFVLLKNATFDDDGTLSEYLAEYPSKNDFQLPEALLGVSKFTSVDDPRVVIPSFQSNSRILCECGEPIKFTEMKSCSSALHNNFEFYLVIGEKCKCGLNPFVLFNSPGNAQVPDGLKPIFE